MTPLVLPYPSCPISHPPTHKLSHISSHVLSHTPSLTLTHTPSLADTLSPLTLPPPSHTLSLDNGELEYLLAYGVELYYGEAQGPGLAPGQGLGQGQGLAEGPELTRPMSKSEGVMVGSRVLLCANDMTGDDRWVAVNTPYQHILSTHPINISCQHILSIQLSLHPKNAAVNISFQYSCNTSYEPTLLTPTLSTLTLLTYPVTTLPTHVSYRPPLGTPHLVITP